jgi:hypothetical protein
MLPLPGAQRQYLFAWAGGYAHPAQEEEEQPPQPEPALEVSAGDPLEDLPMPKRDRSFSVFFDPH